MKPRIAIACSGLGHVNRGSEIWASGAADALHQAEADVTLFGGGENVHTSSPYLRVPNLRRDHPAMRSWLSWHHRYLLEQRSFAIGLARRLKRERFDLVHLCDPALAWIIQRGRPPGCWRVIYQNGLLLSPSWCQRFDCVQLLAPQGLAEAQAQHIRTDNWHVIPHQVNVERFIPALNRDGIRARLFGTAVSAKTPVILAVGDLSPDSNKRLSWIVEELARSSVSKQAHLLVAGQASAADRERFVSASKCMIGDRLHVFVNLPSSGMPEIYQAADLFVHAALREPFGIVFLEAMASGLPVIAHKFPVTEWIVGDGGTIVDMSAPGHLAGALDDWISHEEKRATIGRHARDRAISEFSPQRIIPKYLEMYEKVHSRR